MNQEPKRKFKGIWIPRSVWLDPTMSIVEKALLVEIDSLDNEDGCIAGNEYFAKFFQISARQIRRYITRLADQGWVVNTPIGRNRRRLQVAHRLIILKDTSDRPDGHKRPSADGHKRPHSNTGESNTGNNLAPSGAGIAEVIELFGAVNPSVAKLYGNTTQRKAVERMLKTFGREKLETMIRALPVVNAKPYWPKSTTPHELENNLGRYKALNESDKNKKSEKSKYASIPSR